MVVKPLEFARQVQQPSCPGPSLYAGLVVVVVMLMRVCLGQAQTVSVTLIPGSSVQGESATLNCSFSIDVPATFNNLEWRQREILIADFYEGSTAPFYANGYAEPSYNVTRSDSNSYLVISNVQYAVDDGEYSCTAIYSSGPNFHQETAKGHLIVYVLPSSIVLSDSTGSYPSTSGTAYLVEGVDHQFTCEVADINPGASFTWSVGGGGLTPATTSNTTGNDGLTNSTSMVTLSPTWVNHGQVLQCQASNKADRTGMSISVTIDVKVPPKASSMSLSDFSGTFLPGSSVRVEQDSSHTFTCQAESRPAARIQWFLGPNDYLQSTISPSTEGGDGLIITTSTWTFTPGRDNHRQEVKCEASTDESEMTFPSVMVFLNVTGPPDTPQISGNTPMTENQTSILTCRADQGYPDDWDLMWSNGGALITGPSTSSSASGDRYMFTSTFSFTPLREDNGKTITCAAERGSWSSQPDGSLGPINVQFCARTVNVTMCPSVAAGNAATLRCVAESSNPATTLTWSKDGVELTTPTDQSNTPGDYGGNVTSVAYTTGTLTKNNNTDVYRCCATNTAISSCDADLCSMCTLDVKYAPDFTSLSQSPDNPVIEGNEVNLTCTVDANPLPGSIVWVKQGSSDALSSSLNDVTSTLTLSNIRREQAGNYTCRANNGVPTDDQTTEVISSPVTVIVYYETNITSKDINVIGVKDRQNADLPCTAKGNPTPSITWYSPNNTEIISGMDSAKFTVKVETISGDYVYGFEVTSTLTIAKVDSRVDYGAYTCISSNGIGENDSLTVNLTGTRMPNPPTNVRITDKTAESLTVKWTEGHNGGENQSFQVGHVKLPVSMNEEILSQNISATNAGENEYTVTDLESYTQYEIRVYAQNTVGKNSEYGKTTGRTLPPAIDENSGPVIEFNTDSNTVKIEGLKMENVCIQLEVKYVGNDVWQECGKCIQSDQTVSLSTWCQSQKRRRRATGDVDEVRAKLCIDGTCGKASSPVKKVKNPTSTTVKPRDNITGTIVGAVLGGVVLMAIIAVLVVYLMRTSATKHGRQRRESSSGIELQSPVRHQLGRHGISNEGQQNIELSVIHSATLEQGIATYANVQIAHKPFPRDQLTIVKELGHGAFGLVLLAEATGIIERSKVTKVAVKTLKEGAGASDKADMIRELDLMKILPDHPNVVKLLSFCVEQDPPYIIVEFLSRGNLKVLLQNSRSKAGQVYDNLHGISKSLTSKNLMKFAKDVADGMTFVSSQQCIHRDLAARNVLVAEDMTCKVSDFGLARDVMNIKAYERESEGPLPMRWMALESLVGDVYTTESDVWSYGVLFWEIVTLGARPYPSVSAKMLIGELQNGYRMPKPPHCQEELYEIMLRCWQEDPGRRPTFKMISDKLNKLMNARKECISLRDFEETIYEVVRPDDKSEKA